MVSEVENTRQSAVGSLQSTAACRLFTSRDQHGFRKRVADAFRRRTRNLGDRQVYEPALVRIERSELLIEAGLLRLLSQQPGHLAKFDVFAFSVLKRVDEDAPFVRQRPSVRHVDHVLQRLERLPSMADQKLGFLAREIEVRAIWRLLHAYLDAHAKGA